MSVAAALELRTEEEPSVSAPASVTSVASLRRPSALSLSSLSDENSVEKRSDLSKFVADEACRDVERELAAIETRLNLYKDRHKCNDDRMGVAATTQGRKKDGHKTMAKGDDSASGSPASSLSSRRSESPTFSKLSKARKQAGEVADEVATTLLKCDQLLQRVQSCGVSRASSVSSTRERGVRVHPKARKMSTSSRHSEPLSDSTGSRASSSLPAWEVTNQLAIEEEETRLAQKAAAVKRFGAQCQRDIETSTAAIGTHHKQMQASYLKELQRKYDSKKHMTLMALREKYEKETKTLVRAKVEEYECEETVAMKQARATLLEERNRVLQDLQRSHEAGIEEQLSQLEVQLSTETEREKIKLNNQLQEEFRMKLKKMQDECRESLDRWEIELRHELEQQLLNHREATVALLLKTQEERTSAMKLEIQSSHHEKEQAELQKLKKALAFGAQAQLQQLRKRLEMEHDEKVHEIKSEASLSLEKSTEELRQMLMRSHREQQDQLKHDIETKNRVAVMELHDNLQVTQQESLQALRDTAEQRKIGALDAYRQDFELECRRELQALEQTLEQEMKAKLQQLEIDHADECELKLEELRNRAVNQHTRELEAKKSRMIQCKNVLLAEASAFLSLESNVSEEVMRVNRSTSEAPEGDLATAHLQQLKKHLSKELAQYVDVMIAEFDELAEEQSILVAKITESTQLYLSFKRQFGVLEAQNLELTSGLETLHDRLQQKDAICKKLYQANDALLKRLQTPVLQKSMVAHESDLSSSRFGKAPPLAKALKSAASWHKNGGG